MSWFYIALISAILSAASAVSQKKVLFSLSALEFSFLVSLFNILFSIPFFFAFDIGSISSESLAVLFIKSANYHYIGLALLLFTASSILDKVLLGRYKMPPNAFMAFQQVFYGIVIGAVYLFSSKIKRNPLNSFDKKVWFWIILIAVLTAGYRYTQIKAIKIAPVSLVLSVKRISVFIAVIIGGKMFNEKNLLKKALATAIMVAGAIMIMEEG